MPLVGLTSFLHPDIIELSTWVQMRVNALSRAHIISTSSPPRISSKRMNVSMPLVGLTSFLPWDWGRFVVLGVACVNALSRAHIISTLQKAQMAVRKAEGVNALSRAHIISTAIRRLFKEVNAGCQCP